MKKHLYLFFCIAFVTCVPDRSFSQIITTFAGTGLMGNTGDNGPAKLARFHTPTSLAMDANGNIYVNDEFYNIVRKIDPSGTIKRFAGSVAAGSGGDGGPAIAPAAQLNQNWGIATDAAGNLYIADQNNSKLRKVSTAGILSTVAGVGHYGDSLIGGPAVNAYIGRPISVATDATGNIYISDQGRGFIYKVDAAGIITKIAGNGFPGGFAGDAGPAINATVDNLFGITVDNAGNIYICDGSNNRVRKINTAGIISTVAGNGTAGFSGDGGPAISASLNNPTGIFVTKSGYLYIADFYNNRIRKVSPGGIITTVAGTGVGGYNGDNIPAVAANLNHPTSVMLDTFENIYIADCDNMRIRKINNVLSFTGGEFQGFNICQNNVPQPINTLLAVRDISSGELDTWSLLAAPVHGTANVAFTATSSGGIITPTGLTYAPATSYVGPDSFKVKVSNSISSDIITIYVVVDSNFTVCTITGPSSVCVGSSITLNASIPGGTWSGNALASLNPHTSSCSVTGVAAGVDTINYTITNTCGTVFSSSIVNINPLPDVGVINGPDAICISTSVALTENIPGGTWSSSNDIKAPISPTGVVTGKGPGVYTMTYTVANAWCTAAAIHQIKIETFPDAGTLIGPLKLCVNEQTVLTNAVTGGSWSTSNSVLTVTGGTVTGVSQGSGVITYSVTNTCGTAINVKTITVNPSPESPEIKETQGLLSVNPIYRSYKWYMNSDAVPGANTDTLTAFGSGIFNVMVTNEFGCSSYSQSLEYIDCIASDILIYPNPASSKLRIQWCKKVTVKLMCMDGKEVAVNANTNELDMSNLPNAVYIISIFDRKGNKLMTRRITKLAE